MSWGEECTVQAVVDESASQQAEEPAESEDGWELGTVVGSAA